MPIIIPKPRNDIHMNPYIWWQSQEMIAKLGTIATVLILCLSGLTIILKVRGEHLKKQADLEFQSKLKIASEKAIASEKQIETLTNESIKAQKTIEDVKIKAQKAASGIYSGYDFDGGKRDTIPGSTNVVFGEESMVYQKIIKLHQENNNLELLNLCKEQISKTPEWLTPYFFLGIAEANTGNKDAAISNFEYVLKEAPNHPKYQEARGFIKQLKGL